MLFWEHGNYARMNADWCSYDYVSYAFLDTNYMMRRLKSITVIHSFHPLANRWHQARMTSHSEWLGRRATPPLAQLNLSSPEIEHLAWLSNRRLACATLYNAAEWFAAASTLCARRARMWLCGGTAYAKTLGIYHNPQPSPGRLINVSGRAHRRHTYSHIHTHTHKWALSDALRGHSLSLYI